MFAVFKAKAALPDQLQKQLVHHAGWLQQILRPFAAKQRPRNLPKLWVNKLKQVIDGGGVARSPIAEKHRDFARFRHLDDSLNGSIDNPDKFAPVPFSLAAKPV
jgi:hypothetical protein